MKSSIASLSIGLEMGCHPVRVPLVPWSDIEPSDLCEANGGELEMYRDTRIGSVAERQIGMVVVGQFNRGIALGLIAVRCERQGAKLIPLSLQIPETPIAISPRESALHSNPRRQADGDEGDGA